MLGRLGTMGPRQLKFLSNRWSDSLFKFDRIILSECRTIFMKNKKNGKTAESYWTIFSILLLFASCFFYLFLSFVYVFSVCFYLFLCFCICFFLVFLKRLVFTGDGVGVGVVSGVVKCNGIGVRTMRTFPFLPTPLMTPLLTLRLWFSDRSRKQIEAEG